MASVTSPGAGCGKHESSGVRAVALAAIRSKTPLYVMKNSGRLLKVELSSGTTTVLSDRGFYMMPTLRPSGDGRWLSYSGVLKSAKKTQYWLFDRSSNTERLVYEHPAWGGGIPSFSPDSRYLAISASYDSRWDSDSSAGLFLFDTATSRLLTITLPARTVSRRAWVSTDWSQDGKALLIMVKSPMNEFSYFLYRPANRKIEAISGQYNSKEHRHDFSSRTRAIPAAEELVPRSDLGQQSAWSPSRKWHAYFDQGQENLTYRLFAKNKEQVIKAVAFGRYDQCEGRTLVISGWLDDRHLVYRISMAYFIFDVETGSTADLFGDDDMPSFTW